MYSKVSRIGTIITGPQLNSLESFITNDKVMKTDPTQIKIVDWTVLEQVSKILITQL